MNGYNLRGAIIPNMSKKSILEVTSIHPDYDSRIWKLCTSLINSGYEVLLLCPWKIPNGEIINGVKFITFSRNPHRIIRILIFPYIILFRLLPLLRKVDIIHFHDIDILPLMSIISLMKPVVYDVHENYPEEMLARYWVPDCFRPILFHIVRFGQCIFSRLVKNVILVTPTQKKHFLSKAYNIFYLYNYASEKLLSQVKDDYMTRPDLVIYTGSCYESNGLSLLLEVALLAKSSIPTLKFAFPDRFGNNEEYRQEILKKIIRYGLQDIVTIYPNLPPHELFSIVNKATIAISPDLRTPNRVLAIPTKLFEFMAAGLPIVGSDLPYALDLFTRSKVGILAQPESPESFLRAIKKLVNDRSLGFEIGKNGQRVFMEKFTWESQIPGLLEFYNTILIKKFRK